jgi:tetratricopeptide (TPR) repeat protein
MKKGAGLRGHSRQALRPVEKNEPTARSNAGRWRKLVATSVLLASCIIFVVVMLTPKKPIDMVPQHTVASAVDQPPPIGNQAMGNPAVRFPDQSAEVDVSELTKELEALAVQLQQNYPSDSGAFHFAAQIYSSFNQTESAERAWRKAIELGPVGPGPFVGLAEQLLHAGRATDATAVLLRGQEFGFRTAEMALTLAEAYENDGQLGSAKDILNQAVGDFPDQSELWLARGRILNQLNEFSDAETSLLRHIILVGKSEAALALLNTAQVRQGNREAASKTRQEIADLRQELHKTEDGFQGTYETTLRRIAFDMLLAAGSLAEKFDRLDEAYKRYWRAIELSPSSGQAYMSLAAVVRKQGRFQELLEVHLQLVRIQPENLLNYLNLASVGLQSGDVQLAKSTLLQAVARDPQGYIAQAALARLLASISQVDEALEYAKLVVERNPSADAFLLLAHVHTAANRKDLAELAIAEAKRLDPSNALWTKSFDNQ